MIAVERPAPETDNAVRLFEAPARQPAGGPRLVRPRSGRTRPRLTRLGSRVSAIGLVATLLVTLGGSGVLANNGIPLGLQARAVALHQHWAQMRADGIPELDLATLEQEWTYTQATQFMGVAAVFWWPGANEILDQWQARAEAIWARDLSLYRAGAVAANQNLHHAIGNEPGEQLKSRLDMLSVANTPGEFAVLRANWDLEARLVPIDRKIAVATGAALSMPSRSVSAMVTAMP